jgi:hypothetical protein
MLIYLFPFKSPKIQANYSSGIPNGGPEMVFCGDEIVRGTANLCPDREPGN